MDYYYLCSQLKGGGMEIYMKIEILENLRTMMVEQIRKIHVNEQIV